MEFVCSTEELLAGQAEDFDRVSSCGSCRRLIGRQEQVIKVHANSCRQVDITAEQMWTALQPSSLKPNREDTRASTNFCHLFAFTTAISGNIIRKAKVVHYVEVNCCLFINSLDHSPEKCSYKHPREASAIESKHKLEWRQAQRSILCESSRRYHKQLDRR